MSNGASATYVTSPVARKKWRARSVVSLVIFLVATLLLPVAVIAHWGHRTVVDTERYLATVTPLAESPEVQQAIADTVTEAVISQVNTDEVVGGVLGAIIPNEQLAGLIAGPLTTGVNSLIGEAVDRFVASELFQDAWVALNKTAQQGLILALEGDPSGVVQIKGDSLVLDISSVLVVVQESLVDQGISIAANVTIPDTDRQIVLMSSPAFEQLRTIWAFASPALSFIILLVALLFTLSVLLATRRARTAVAVGVVAIVWGLVLQFALAAAETEFTNAFAGTFFEQASVVLYGTFLAYLLEGIASLIILGIALIAVGWFAGRTTSAERARAAMVRGFFDLGSRLPESIARIGQPLRDYAPFVRWGLLFLWVIVVFYATDFQQGVAFAWTLLFAGVYTALEIVMHAPDDRPVEVVVEQISITVD